MDPFAGPRPPSHGSFPHRSWPANIRPPAEGTLDREQYRRLLDLLPGERCFALYAGCWSFADPQLFRGTLDEAREQYDDPAQRGGPSNLWPADRSWLVYSDYDLWATRVSGSRRLIAELAADPELETV